MKTNKYIFKLLIVIIISILIVSCRGHRSEKEPFHLNPNLDWQPKFNAQRLVMDPPEHSIPFGNDSILSEADDRDNILQTDTVKYKGKKNGKWVTTIPFDVSKDFVLRGQDRYNIYCSVCHTKTGNGQKSLIAKHGWIPSDITAKATVNKTDGELYDIVSNGIRTMPGYKKKMSVEDRWAIVAYIRALQNTRVTNKQVINQILQKKDGDN